MADLSLEAAPWIAIAPMRMELFNTFYECLDSVCREKKYLSFTEAPPIEMSREYVGEILEKSMPMIVAFIPGPTVVGWCDIYGFPQQSLSHSGRMGLAMRADFRGQGIGGLLMQRALKAARTCRLERVELEVFGSNQRAIDLYRSFDFEEEGVKRRARKIDGVYEDIIMMAKHL